MGECLLNIAIAKELLILSKDNNNNNDDDTTTTRPTITMITDEEEEESKAEGSSSTSSFASSSSSSFLTISRRWSADATVRNIVESSVWKTTTKNNNNITKKKQLLSFIKEGDENKDDSEEEERRVEILPMLENGMACLWDVTSHPAKDISDWPTVQYPETIGGPNCKTLWDAGWFPSGSFQLLPPGHKPITSNLMMLDDNNNNSNTATISTSTVKLSDPSLASSKPSQILGSVKGRHEGTAIETTTKEDEDDAIRLRAENKQRRIDRERKRFQRLEDNIKRLDASLMEASRSTGTSSIQGGKTPKKKVITEQVRKMLIKSRCTGLPHIREQDRIYMHIIIMTDDNDTTQQEEEQDFRYFAPQDTVGLVLSRWSSTAQEQGKEIELLVPVDDGSMTTKDAATVVYRKLPLLTRLYQAKTKGYIHGDGDMVNRVVVRIYHPNHDVATTTIEEHEQETKQLREQQEQQQQKQQGSSTTAATASSSSPMDVIVEENNDIIECMTNERLVDALAQYDKESGVLDSKKKKTSSTSLKVQQMKMKSRAVGNKDRVKVEDRFYVELITVIDDGVTCIANPNKPTKIGFVAQWDRVERLASRECVDVETSNDRKWAYDLVIVPSTSGDVAADNERESNNNKEIPNDNNTTTTKTTKFLLIKDKKISMEDLEAKRILKRFDRVIVCLYAV